MEPLSSHHKIYNSAYISTCDLASFKNIDLSSYGKQTNKQTSLRMYSGWHPPSHCLGLWLCPLSSSSFYLGSQSLSCRHVQLPLVPPTSSKRKPFIFTFPSNYHSISLFAISTFFKRITH